MRTLEERRRLLEQIFERCRRRCELADRKSMEAYHAEDADAMLLWLEVFAGAMKTRLKIINELRADA